MSNPKRLNKRQYIYLTVISLTAIGLGFFTASSYGIGVSNDGVSMLSAAQNFLQGNGLTQYNGTPLIYWAPLYPLAVAILSMVTGIELLSSGLLINAFAWGLSIFLVGILFRRSFPHNPEWLYVGSFLMLASVSMLSLATNFGTDILFIAEFILFLVLSQIYLIHGNKNTLYWMGILTAVSMFTRYNGIIFAASGVIFIFYYHYKADMRAAVKSVFAYSLISGLPFLIWIVLRNYPLTGTILGARVYSAIQVSDNFVFSYWRMIRWFIPQSISDRIPITALLITVLTILFAYIVSKRWKTRRPLLSPLSMPIVVTAVIYFVFVISTTISRDHIFFWDDRFQLPLYAPLLFLIFTVVQYLRVEASKISKFPKLGTLLFLGFALWSFYPLWTEYKFIRTSIDSGIPYYNLFNLSSYQESSFVEQIQGYEFDSSFGLFSNRTGAMYFITGLYARGSIYEVGAGFSNDPDEEYLLDNYRKWFDGQEAYLIWFLPNEKKYYYSPAELTLVYEMQPLFTSKDGVMYLMRPKP